MYSSLQTIHSMWAYIALIALIAAAVNGLIGLLGGKPWSSRDRKIALFAFIFCHIQLLLGLILLFVSPYWTAMMDAGMGAVMKDSTLRLYTVEHPLINIVAIALITIGWSRHKKQASDNGKFKSIGVFYTIGLLLLLSRIPWSAWLG